MHIEFLGQTAKLSVPLMTAHKLRTRVSASAYNLRLTFLTSSTSENIFRGNIRKKLKVLQVDPIYNALNVYKVQKFENKILISYVCSIWLSLVL